MLWEDEDFECCKMDDFCQELLDDIGAEAEENDGGDVRVIRAWQETWEKKRIGPQGDSVFQTRLVRKYGGLKWLDPDDGDSLRTAHPEQMFFEKKKGNNQYHVFAMKAGYDQNKEPELQKDAWDVWAFESPLYDQVTEYNAEKVGVMVYQQDDDECDSEAE